jgi:hypothetical protein
LLQLKNIPPQFFNPLFNLNTIGNPVIEVLPNSNYAVLHELGNVNNAGKLDKLEHPLNILSQVNKLLPNNTPYGKLDKLEHS